jgi:hypothetical protein
LDDVEVVVDGGNIDSNGSGCGAAAVAVVVVGLDGVDRWDDGEVDDTPSFVESFVRMAMVVVEY